MTDNKTPVDPGSLDPAEFLRALLAIKPEDAEEVRKDATTKAVLPDDDDPDVVAGMKRLHELREQEGDVPEVRP